MMMIMIKEKVHRAFHSFYNLMKKRRGNPSVSQSVGQSVNQPFKQVVGYFGSLIPLTRYHIKVAG